MRRIDRIRRALLSATAALADGELEAVREALHVAFGFAGVRKKICELKGNAKMPDDGRLLEVTLVGSGKEFALVRVKLGGEVFHPRDLSPVAAGAYNRICQEMEKIWSGELTPANGKDYTFEEPVAPFVIPPEDSGPAGDVN